MKTYRATSQTSTQEECGIWLDTVQLKGRAKQKQLTRPISKLLSPFAGGGGYSLAVALNFTQTKSKMPNTKQSSISSYFAPQHISLNKTSTSEERSADQISPPSSSSTSTPCASTSTLAFGTKCGIDCELSNFNTTMACHPLTLQCDVKREELCPERTSKSVTDYERTVCQDDYEDGYTSPVNMYRESEEMNEPERKQEVTKTSSSLHENDPAVEQCSQETWNTCSSPENTQELMVSNEMIRCNYITHDSESQFNLTHQESTMGQGSEISVLESLHNEEGFGGWLGMEGRNSPQKHLKCPQLSQKEEDKENTRSPLLKSPKKCSSLLPLRALSSHKLTDPNNLTYDRNILERLGEKPEGGSLASQHKWPTPRCSPLKKGQPQRPWREVEEESLSSLFTQNSEGFRVIAHRGLTASSPLKDQTVVNFGGGMKTYAYKSPLGEEEEEEEDEMLFTQDSQGNMVIKH